MAISRPLPVGAIAVSESDPNVIYVGTGETSIRSDVSHGDGVYRSTDGGRSWMNVGLRDSRHLGRIGSIPDNPDLLYVAALGHAFGPNEERGVFRSRDSGENWERVLYKSERAGAQDIAFDSGNPRILYASIHQTRRTPWMIDSGGEDCGLWRSTDGGDSWHDISHQPWPTRRDAWQDQRLDNGSQTGPGICVDRSRRWCALSFRRLRRNLAPALRAAFAAHARLVLHLRRRGSRRREHCLGAEPDVLEVD